MEHMMCALLAGGHVLGFMRSAKQKAFTMDDLALVQQFRQPLENFIQSQLRAEQQLGAIANAHAALDQVHDGVLLVAATSEVLTANAAACKYLGVPLAPLRKAPSDWAQLLAPQRLRLDLVHPPLWKLALDARRSGQTATGSVSGVGSARELAVQVHWECLPAASGGTAREAAEQVHILLRGAKQLNPAEQVQRCANSYHLTDTESRVLAGLIASTPREVASELGLKITTVRTHMAAIFAKTSTRRQAELIWVVASC
jgi:DNA-binding CsgD family transcriptional regulator